MKAAPKKPRSRKKNSASFLPGIVGGERVLVAQIPKKESEAALSKRVQIALATAGAVVWRNHSGVGKHASGNWVRMGLGVGSADLVGFVKMDGGFARFFAIELKTKSGRLSREQERWLSLVNRWGGYARCVRSVEEAVDSVREARQGVRR